MILLSEEQAIPDRKAMLLISSGALLALVLILMLGYFFYSAKEREAAGFDDNKAALSVISKPDELNHKKAQTMAREEIEKRLLMAKSPDTGAGVLKDAFDALCAKRGITVFSRRALPHSEEEDFFRVPVEFRFKAGLEELRSLFSDIRQAPVLMGVKSVRVSAPKDDKSPLDVVAIIESAYKSAGA